MDAIQLIRKQATHDNTVTEEMMESLNTPI